MSLKQKPHSSDYFVDSRDLWWNMDHLKLIAKRWKLTRRKRVLDVGCGVGHWGRTLLPILSSRATLVGVDREAKWVSKATKNAMALGDKCRYQQGDAMNLPFEDASFDLVTCQTLLIHLSNPQDALNEFKRVLKPGGALLVAEPNNLCRAFVHSSVHRNLSMKEQLDLASFQLICEKGKIAVGEGDNSLGDLLPGIMSAVGLQNIQVTQNDKPFPVFPPYESREQQLVIRETLAWSQRQMWIWDKDETQRYFVNGGGNKNEFRRYWALVEKLNRETIAAIRRKEYHSAEGTIFYLVHGIK